MLRIGSAALALGLMALAWPAVAATSSPAMESCSADWAKLKADNKVPAGETWPKFWSACSKTYAAAHPADATKAPTPAAAPATKVAIPAPAKVAPMATKPAEEEGVAVPGPDAAATIDTVKPKKPRTPGQEAAIVRIRACGAEWQASKKAGTLPVGAKWPQYWSDCNKRLKAKGQ